MYLNIKCLKNVDMYRNYSLRIKREYKVFFCGGQVQLHGVQQKRLGAYSLSWDLAL